MSAERMAEIKRRFWRQRLDLQGAEDQRHFLVNELRAAGADPTLPDVDAMREAWIQEGPPDEIAREWGYRP